MPRLSRSSGDEPIEPAGIPWFATAHAAAPRASDVLDAVYDRIERAGERPAWIAVLPRAEARAMLAIAASRREAGEHLPLFGVPFAVKDNIDVAGLPTTAGCPAFAYRPERSARVVELLVAAGAIPVGKTNLDQFATGLSGTRSPYGIPASVFDATRVSGGSSSGSAVAVASGLVAFALGTDTAGSGRVPAAFNNIVGLKPTKGLLSTRGAVPACRSLDCVSVFAGTVGDALAVARVAAGFDPDDPFSRAAPDAGIPAIEPPPGWRFGVPGRAALSECDENALALFEAAAARLEAIGGTRTEIDFAPCRGAADLLYAGPWVAERLAAIEPFATARSESVHPVVREIILAAGRFSAVDAFEGQYRLAALTRLAEREWAKMDMLLLPTAPFVPTIQAVLDDPVGLNAGLGVFTNFVNLMDLSALAVPAGFTPDGLPFGVTLVGRAFEDGALALIGDRLHRALAGATLGGSSAPLPSSGRVEPERDAGRALVAVVGAHLAGQPLNGQLTRRGGRLVASTRTAPGYSLYALPGTVPPKPGLVRDNGAGGIEVEVWSLPIAGFGALVAEIPPPLGIGTVSLADGSDVKGFLCEPHALRGAPDITAFGGWRAYLAVAAPEAAWGSVPQSNSLIPEEVSP